MSSAFKTIKCYFCLGEGEVMRAPCKVCGGSGSREIPLPADLTSVAPFPRPRPDVTQVPQRLYESEINHTVSAFFDAGFEWSLWVGDVPVRGDADTYEQALRAMADAAEERSPEGAFARWWKGE